MGVPDGGGLTLRTKFARARWGLQLAGGYNFWKEEDSACYCLSLRYCAHFGEGWRRDWGGGRVPMGKCILERIWLRRVIWIDSGG